MSTSGDTIKLRTVSEELMLPRDSSLVELLRSQNIQRETVNTESEDSLDGILDVGLSETLHSVESGESIEVNVSLDKIRSSELLESAQESSPDFQSLNQRSLQLNQSSQLDVLEEELEISSLEPLNVDTLPPSDLERSGLVTEDVDPRFLVQLLELKELDADSEDGDQDFQRDYQKLFRTFQNQNLGISVISTLINS